MLKMAVAFAAIAVPLQIVVGDMHGLEVAQAPADEARRDRGALGRRRQRRHAAGAVRACPNAAAERNDYEVAVPRLGSLILTHTWNGSVAGLKDVARRRTAAGGAGVLRVPDHGRPGLADAVARRRRRCGALARQRCSRSRWLLRRVELMLPSGFIALLAGWYVTEIGRQPYVVYGLLRTADAVSPNVAAGSVLASLMVYACVYAIIFGAGIWYLLKLFARRPGRSSRRRTRVLARRRRRGRCRCPTRRRRRQATDGARA